MKMKLQNAAFEDGVPYSFYICPKCKEELLDLEQLRAVGREYRKIKKAKRAVCKMWGNSLALRIPKEVASEYKLKDGSEVLLKKEKKGLMLTPI